MRGLDRPSRERFAHCCRRPSRTSGPGCFSAFYVQSYLAFSLPAVAAGLSVPLIGLSTAAYLYGATIILLAVTSLMASLWVEC